MADAVLLLKGERQQYVAVDSDAGMRAARSVYAGLSRPSAHLIRLGEQEKLASHGSAFSGLGLALASLGELEISLVPDEKLCFGKRDESAAYSKLDDLSLVPSREAMGVKIKPRELDDGEIVMTLWPAAKRAFPALAHRAGKGIWLDLVEQQDKGSRCFVFDEGWNELITVSLPVMEGQVPAVPHCGIGAWLCSAGSKAASWTPGRFEVDPEGESFFVKDTKTGRRYMGKFKTESPDARRIEKVFLERRLSSKGIGALLPSYKLGRA